MHESQKEAGSRGVSILSGIVLFAMLGGAATVAAPSVSNNNTDQLAEGQLAQTDPESIDGILDKQTPKEPGEKIQKDSSEPGKYYDIDNYVWRDVFYACKQETNDSSKIGTLKQDCRPGFIYTVAEIKGVVTVTAEVTASSKCATANIPDSATKCSLDGSNPEKSCPIDPKESPGVVFHKIGNEDPVWVGTCDDVANNDILNKDGTINYTNALNRGRTITADDLRDDLERWNIVTKQGGLSKGLADAFSEQAAVKAKLGAVKAAASENFVQVTNCIANPDCTKKDELLQKESDLAEQREELEKLLFLKENEVRLLAGEPTSNLPKVPDGSGDTTPPPAPTDTFIPQETESGETPYVTRDGDEILELESEALTKEDLDRVTYIDENGNPIPRPNPLRSTDNAEEGSETTAITEETTAESDYETSVTYKLDRANQAAADRLNGQAAQILYEELKDNPDEEVRKEADNIVDATQGNMAQQAGFLSTLSETAKTSVPIPDSSYKGLGISSIDQKKLEIQRAIIETPECAPRKPSIMDCLNAAGLDGSLQGRKDLEKILGTGCGNIGKSKPNICQFESFKKINFEGELTNKSINRVVTLDPLTGKVLEDKVAEVTSKQIIIKARSVYEGGTLAEIEAAEKSLEAGGIVEKGDTVYRSNIDTKNVTVECIDSRAGSVPNPACGATYAESIEAIPIQDTSLSGILKKIRDKSVPTTEYILTDGTGSAYKVADIERQIVASDGNLPGIAVPRDQLSQSVQNLLPEPGSTTRAPTVDDERTLTPITAAIETRDPFPIVDRPKVLAEYAAEDEARQRFYDYYRREQEIIEEELRAQQKIDSQAVKDREAERRGRDFEALQKVVLKMQQERENAELLQRVESRQIRDRYALGIVKERDVIQGVAIDYRTEYMEDSAQTEEIVGKIQAFGYTQEQASNLAQQYVDDGVQGNSTPAEMDAYLKESSEDVTLAYVEKLFIDSIDDARAQVEHAKELLARSESIITGIPGRFYLSEAENRLRKLEEDYAEFSRSDKVSPALQQGIDRVNAGDWEGGSRSVGLSAYADKLEESAREGIEKSNLTDVFDPANFNLVTTGVNGTIAAFTRAGTRVAELASFKGFETPAIDDLKRAVDPYGSDWRDVIEIGTVVVPSGAAVARPLARVAGPAVEAGVKTTAGAAVKLFSSPRTSVVPRQKIRFDPIFGEPSPAPRGLGADVPSVPSSQRIQPPPLRMFDETGVVPTVRAPGAPPPTVQGTAPSLDGGIGAALKRAMKEEPMWKPGDPSPVLPPTVPRGSAPSLSSSVSDDIERGIADVIAAERIKAVTRTIGQPPIPPITVLPKVIPYERFTTSSGRTVYFDPRMGKQGAYRDVTTGQTVKLSEVEVPSTALPRAATLEIAPDSKFIDFDEWMKGFKARLSAPPAVTAPRVFQTPANDFGSQIDDAVKAFRDLAQ